MPTSRKVIVGSSIVVSVLVAMLIGTTVLRLGAYNTQRILESVRSGVWSRTAVPVDRFGDFHLVIREEAHWRPHWLNPIAHRQTYAIAWSPDGAKLAVAYEWGRKIEIIDPLGNDLATAEVPNGPNIGTSLAFANGSSRLLFEGRDFKGVGGVAFTLFDANSGRFEAPISGPFHAEEFSMSPDGRLVAMRTSGDGVLYIYRTSDWRIVGQIKVEGGVTALTFLSNSRHLVVASSPSRFIIIDTKDGRIIKHYKVPGTGEFTPGPATTFSASSLAISPDQKYLVAGAAYKFVPNDRASRDPRGAMQVFRLADGARIASFDLAFPSIEKALWDPKGRYVAFIDRSAHLFLWQPLANTLSYVQINLAGDAWSIAVSPDGSRIAVSGEDGVAFFEVE